MSLFSVADCLSSSKPSYGFSILLAIFFILGKTLAVSNVSISGRVVFYVFLLDSGLYLVKLLYLLSAFLWNDSL